MPLPTLTQQQLQWLKEDLCLEPYLPTLPSYHFRAISKVSNHSSILALDLILENEDQEEACIPASNGPMLGVYPGIGWHQNLNKETGSPIFIEYLVDNELKIITPYFQFDMELESPELLLTRSCHCSVHSRTL
jgi:hypothetical protein